jgi:hypothetical protein
MLPYIAGLCAAFVGGLLVAAWVVGRGLAAPPVREADEANLGCVEE